MKKQEYEIERQRIIKELDEDLNKIHIERDENTLSNSSNKPYWELEKKYKKKLDDLKKKYDSTQ